MDGLLLLDKPEGMTSHDVVFHVRRALNTRSVGHCGTLDPLATGLMIMLIGEATKLSQYILERNKAYVVTAEVGYTTDTLDKTGQILSKSELIPSDEKILAEALKLSGDFELDVPIYSAAKVNGKKLYEYARSGESVTIPKKIMSFFDLELSSCQNGQLKAFMRCSKGSFIRSWVQLLGERLEVGACMVALRRTESMPYLLSDAITLEQLSKLSKSEVESCSAFVGMSRVLPEAPSIRVSGQTLVMLNNGLISHDLRSRLIALVNPEVDHLIKVISYSGNLLALLALESGKGFVIRRVFKEPQE